MNRFRFLFTLEFESDRDLDSVNSLLTAFVIRCGNILKKIFGRSARFTIFSGPAQ